MLDHFYAFPEYIASTIVSSSSNVLVLVIMVVQDLVPVLVLVLALVLVFFSHKRSGGKSQS